MSWFRGYFCQDGTAKSECLVPIDGGEDYESEAEWCIDNYNSTRCSIIRDDAQNRLEFSLLAFYTGLAGSGCFLLFFIFLMINSLEK